MPDNLNMFGARPSETNLKSHYFFLKLKMKFGMKNPYEEKKEELSTDILKNKAREIRAIRGQYDRYVQRLRCLVGTLETVWQNDIQSFFIAELGNMHGPIREYSGLTEKFAAFVDMAANELSQNPGKLDKPAGSAEDEPVPVVLSTVSGFTSAEDVLVESGPFAIPGPRKIDQEHRLLSSVFKVLSIFGVKNPYDKKGLLIDPKALKEGATEMRSIITQYNYNVRKMQYIIDDLQRLWLNDIQTSYIEELENMQHAVSDFSSLADEFASLLEIAAHEIETNKVDLDKASILSDGPEEPMTVVLSNIPYLKRSRFDLKAYDPYFEQTQAGVSTELSLSRKNAEYIYNVYEDHIELVKYIGLKKTVEIPGELDGLPVTHIGFDCFAMAWRVKFTDILMPDSITTVYHGAFRGCHTIRALKLSKNLKYIGNYAFGFLTDLERIDLPENVVSFGMGAFRNCHSLKTITIPKSTLKRIGSDCFYGCKSLERVTIGDDVQDVDGWAFRLCEHLTSVEIGKNVVNIGDSAFYDCVLLKRLDIPEKVASIGKHAFYHRRGMTLGVAAGSAAEQYALENHHEYVNI